MNLVDTKMNVFDGSSFVYSDIMDTEKFFGNPFCVCGENKMDMLCDCTEDFIVHEWTWDENVTTPATLLSRGNREVRFHPTYSSGTAAVRGNLPFQPGHVYYWEIKMLTTLYGTDVMVGVGTINAELKKSAYNFVSLLGSDKESWGFSYTGSVYHNGKYEPYGPPFQKGSMIGIYLDMWKGTLEFFLNRRPLGVAFKSLQNIDLYPMVCSTAAQSAMRVTYSVSHPVSLKLLSLRSLSTNEDSIRQLLEVPGLRKYIANSWWIQVVSRSQKIEEEDDIEMKLKTFACEDEPSIGTSGGCPSCCCKQSVASRRVHRVCVVCNVIL